VTPRASVAKRFVKRWSRRLFAAAGRVTDLGRRNPTSGVRILTYHRVVADTEDPFAIAPDDFARQMALVAGTGMVVSLSRALAEIGDADLAKPRIVLTFDDGTSDFLTTVVPVLSRLGLPATLYVNPSRTGERGFLTWGDLDALAGMKVVVGSHSLDHVSLGGLNRSEVRRQVAESRLILEDRLGQEVTSFAYPFGTLRDFNEEVREEVMRAGYRSACTSINGLNRSGVDPLALRRTKIEQGDSWIYPWILRGHLDGWSLVDRYLSRLQSRYA